MNIGIEIEYWVVDAAGNLCDGHGLTEVDEHVEPEFIDSLIEVQTPPAGDIAQIKYDLLTTLRTVLTEAERTGRSLVPLGTPLTPASPAVTSHRGGVLERIYGDGIGCAKNCAGTHFHFEKGNVQRQLNLLTALDPAVALVSSSPYYLGERIANSSRAYAYRYKAGQNFSRYRELWAYADTAEEWERRLQQAYDQLRAAALNRGVSVEEFSDHFEPEDVVVTPVRLRNKSPTVEWRTPDTALPSQLLQLLEDVAQLVRQTEHMPVEVGEPGIRNERIFVPPFSEVQHLTEDAIDDGLNSTGVWRYLEAMSFDTTRYHPISGQIYGSHHIHEERARKIRLEYANELQKDVEYLRTSA